MCVQGQKKGHIWPHRWRRIDSENDQIRMDLYVSDKTKCQPGYLKWHYHITWILMPGRGDIRCDTCRLVVLHGSLVEATSPHPIFSPTLTFRGPRLHDRVFRQTTPLSSMSPLQFRTLKLTAVWIIANNRASIVRFGPPACHSSHHRGVCKPSLSCQS